MGDVHPRVADVAGALTPVPGGVGPLTIAMLMKNTLTAANRRTSVPDGTRSEFRGHDGAQLEACAASGNWPLACRALLSTLNALVPHAR